MRLAKPVYGKNARRELVSTFLGYNCTDSGGEGSGKSTFVDMVNGGTDKYPFAASRLPRRVTQYDEATCALSGGEVLTRVQPPYLFYGDRQYDLGLTSGEKQIVRMGTNVLILPDGKYFNTASGEFGDIDEGEEFSSDGDTMSMIYLADGKYLRESTSGTSAVYSELEVKYVRADGTVKESVYAAWDYGLKTSRVETCIRLSLNYAPLAYEDGRLYYAREADIEDASNGNYQFSNIVWEELIVEKLKVNALDTELFSKTNLWNGEQYVHTAADDSGCYIHMIPGQKIGDVVNLTAGSYGDNTLYVNYAWRTRTLPIFDYVTVCDNRLFGCRCGMPYDGGEPVNRIYVSAQNDFKAFEQFQGISTDSWWGDVSEEGPFTAACTYNGYPMFFKEEWLYILYGDYPPYSYNPIKLRGVAVGAAKSLVEINSALYYKSRHDIMRYTGSSLNSISEALGDISAVEHAVGGTYRDSYYVALDGVLHVYDTEKGIWSKEDKQSVIDFANVRGEMHFLAEDGTVYTVNGAEENVEWSLTSPPIGYAYPNRKRLSSLQIRIEIGENDELPLVEISFDGGEFKECKVRVNFIDMEGKRSGSIFIPILPGRCELFSYRISGKGSYKLTGVTKVIKECGR